MIDFGNNMTYEAQMRRHFEDGAFERDQMFPAGIVHRALYWAEDMGSATVWSAVNAVRTFFNQRTRADLTRNIAERSN